MALSLPSFMATSLPGLHTSILANWRASAAIAFALLLVTGTTAAQAQPQGSTPPPPPAEPVAAPTTTAPASTAPASTAPAVPTPHAAVCASDEVHMAARSPAHLLRIALSYVALADRSGDPWDAVLALAYFERGRALDRKLATPELEVMMTRMRRLAGRRPYQPPIAGVRYPVYFSAYDVDKEYDVSTPYGRCTTPCTLEMPIGPQVIHTSGAGELATELFVPTGQSRVRLQHDSSGQKTAGAVLIPAGIVVGGGLWALGIICSGDGACFTANVIAWPLVGVGMIAAGIALIAGAEAPPADANRIETVGLAPWLTPGPAGSPQMTGVVGSVTAAF